MIDFNNVIKLPDNTNDRDSLYFYYTSLLLQDMPSTLNIFYDLKSEKFWDIISDLYPTALENKESTYTIEQSINEKNELIESYDHFLKLNDNLFCIFTDLVYVDDDNKEIKAINGLKFLFKKSKEMNEEIKTIATKMGDAKMDDDNKNKYYVIISSPYGYRLQVAKAKDVNVDIELNYGKTFKVKNEKIIKNLTDGESGILLLHGDPGTGKSTYIRHLIKEICDKKTIIYVPSYMMGSIASPEFIAFMRSNKESILILEDAESVLSKRGNNRTDDQAVSNILNMTDGILNDMLKLQIIATFNTSKKDIDPAIMRSGRLIDVHMFDKLNKEEAEKLSKKINKNKIYDKGATLSEIYKEDDDENEDLTKPKKVGFKK